MGWRGVVWGGWGEDTAFQKISSVLALSFLQLKYTEKE